MKAWKAEEAGASSETNLLEGTIIKIVGLMSHPEWNSTYALCLKYQRSAGRYAVKRIRGGQTLLVKSCHIIRKDAIWDAIQDTPIGSVDLCVSLLGKLMQLFRGWQLHEPRACRETFANESRAPTKQRWLRCYTAASIGHEFILDSCKCDDGDVYTRLIHCFFPIYSAKEWLFKAQWMTRTETATFCAEMANLKALVDAFVREELLPELAVPENWGLGSEELGRQEACRIMDANAEGAAKIGIRPSQWDVPSVESYGLERGGVTLSPPPGTELESQCSFELSWTVAPWLKILRLSEHLFHGADGLFPLGALAHQGDSWKCRDIAHGFPVMD